MPSPSFWLTTAVLVICLAVAQSNSLATKLPDDMVLELRNTKLSVLLDARTPRVLQYRLADSAAALNGGAESAGPEICVFDVARGRAVWFGSQVRYKPVRKSQQITYRASVVDGDIPAADLKIVFRLKGDELEVRFDDVREHPGYELMRLVMPSLVSVTGDQPNAHLAIPTHSGRLIPIAKCPPHRQVHPADWFNPAPVCVVYEDTILAMLTAPSVDDNLISMTGEDESKIRYGGISVEFVHRLGKSYRFIAQSSSFCRVKITADVNGDGVCDWLDGAAIWHKQVNARLSPLYRKAFTYKIMLDWPGNENPTTFDDALELIKRINRLTDGAPQIAYLVGWQDRGHDTAYPDVSKVNSNTGGMAPLKALIENAKKLNCIVSFHDNYDDAYISSPAWDPDVIARDENGDLMKGGIWAGGQSYIIGNASYARKSAAARVRQTVETYPISKSYHIDVLSAVPARYDFSPDHPAGATANLKGKYFVLDEFKRHGIDVTSEGLTDPFVSRISLFWHLIRNRDQVYPVESRIPLIPFMYHGKVAWGGGDSSKPVPIIDALYHGATHGRDLSKDTPDSVITDMYYLISLPASLLRPLQMTDYKVDGDTKTVFYGKDTFVEVNETAERYRVVLHGRLISRDFSIFAPVSENKRLLYSRAGGELKYPAPQGWTDPASVTACDLLTREQVRLATSLESGMLTVQVAAGRPYRISYAESK